MRIGARFGGRALASAIAGLALVGAAADGPVDPAAAGEPARTDLDIANDVLAQALATALQSVYDQYTGSAHPIPADVREQLEGEYGPELSRARFVVSPAAVRLLGTIDRFQGTNFGKGMHALTIDDLILLASDPEESESPYTLWIWAHELHHVHQYREHESILAFARAYLRDCDAIEQAADARANRALDMDVSVRHCLQ